MASTVFATVSTPGPPGPAGPAGPPGYTGVWIVQSGPPSNLIGNNGDMYLNNSTGAGGGDVYGPKAGGVWPASTTNIKGAPGTPGAPGYSPTYIVQASPPTAGQGNNGDMYINSATSDLYGPKTAGVWGPIVANLKGQTGAQGPPGVGYNPRGAWIPGTIYSQGDQVSYNSQLYISLQGSNVNNQPDTSPTYWEPVAAGGGSQTPWRSAIDAAGFNLGNAGRISVQNSGAVLPDANTNNPAVIVGVTAAGSTAGEITVCGNASSGAMGAVNFANYANATAEKRIAIILSATDGAANAGTLQFLTSSAGAIGERMRITSGGNIGIGTGSPQCILDANGMIRATASGAPASGAGVEVAYGGAQGFVSCYDRGAGAYKNLNISGLQIWLNPTNGGNVGIGTVTPACALHVFGNNGFDGMSAFFSVNSSTPGIAICNTGSIGYIEGMSSPTGTRQNMALQPNSGYVGIGTVSPARRLEVASDGTNWSSATFSGNGGTDKVSIGNFGNCAVIAGNNSSLTAVANLGINPGGGNVLFCYGGGGGSVGINTSSPAATLQVVGTTIIGSVTSTPGARNLTLGNPNGLVGLVLYAASTGQTWYVDNRGNADTPNSRLSISDGATEYFTIATSGNIGLRKSNPGYELDATGDCNITGTYRVNGVPISTGGGGITTMNVVTGSRSFGTNYQNTNGKTAFVVVTATLNGSSTLAAASDANGTPTTTVAVVNNVGGGAAGFYVGFWCMANHWYRVQMNSGSATVTSWIEYL